MPCPLPPCCMSLSCAYSILNLAGTNLLQPTSNLMSCPLTSCCVSLSCACSIGRDKSITANQQHGVVSPAYSFFMCLQYFQIEGVKSVDNFWQQGVVFTSQYMLPLSSASCTLESALCPMRLQHGLCCNSAVPLCGNNSKGCGPLPT